LRVTDWFFPDGFDHHHFLAGIPGVSPLMQTIARRVAGLGVMPTTTKPRGKGEELSVDALVIGGGASGIACASALSRAGKTTLLADDALSLGGSMGALAPSLLRDLLTRHPLDRVDVRAHATVVGVFDGTALLASSEGASLIHPRAIVLATGGHDGVAVFEGNDVPGVFSARAAARLARAGVAIGARVVLAGDGPYATALASALDGVSDVTRVAMDDVLRVEGQTRVGGVVVRAGGEERRLRADALAVAAPVSPSYELIEQVGGRVKWVPHRGFFPVAEPNGAIAEDAFVTGELCGVAFDADALSQSGTRVAEAVLARLG
jgi:sarcosine oxidase subunit alpha